MGRRIRVLELRSVRGTGGGPEKTIMLGAALANRDKFDVTVCYVRDARDQEYRPVERAADLDIEYVEVRERNSFDPGIWPQLRSIIRERQIDIVHAHEYKTDLLAYLLARRTGVIPFATAHAWTGNTARERFLYYPLDKKILARYPHVIAVSTQIKNELIRHGARAERITVILNAIDPSLFRRDDGRYREAVREEFGISPDDVVMGAVGRLEHQKRFDLLLEVTVKLLAAHPRIRLVIVGDGSLRQSLEAQAATLGISNRCVFAGHRNDIGRIHHAFDLFVQSSDYEGTPNAVLEAMAMETPFVATDVGGTSELAFDGVHGTIVPKGDSVALQAGIQSILADPGSARRRAAEARRRVESDLSFEARTRRLEGIYELLFDRRAAHA